VIEQRLLVCEQSVVTGVELVDLRNREVSAQQIRQRAALEPLAVQSPFAPRRQQAVGYQNEQNLIPARAFAARRKPLTPKPIEGKLLPQSQRDPARTPLARPAQPHLRQLQTHDRGVRQQPFAAILGKQ
jgi:hypothetical protein